MGSSLAGYFGVFHRLMASRLKEVPTAGAGRLAAIAGELQDSCCSAEHSYAHATQLLVALGRHKNGASVAVIKTVCRPEPSCAVATVVLLRPKNRNPRPACECITWQRTTTLAAGANFRRLAHQLEAYAAAPSRAGPELWRIQSWLAPPNNSVEDAEVCVRSTFAGTV